MLPMAERVITVPKSSRDLHGNIPRNTARQEITNASSVVKPVISPAAVKVIRMLTTVKLTREVMMKNCAG